MFSQWAVEVLKRLTVRFQPKIRLGYPIRFLGDLLFALSVFLWFNRRPVTHYNLAFWSQLLYLVQLFKVVYTLRFLLVELVFRELRTFFCFIHPLVKQIAILRRWQNADPCVFKVVNLAFFLVFICLNLLLAYGIEWVGGIVWDWVKDQTGGATASYYLPKKLTFASLKRRRRKRRGKRYKMRSRSRSAHVQRPLFDFWPFTKSSWLSSPRSSSSYRISETFPNPLPRSYRTFTGKTTRSGKKF